MAELKTRPTRKSARKYIRELEHPRRREDGRVLLDLFCNVTGKQPVMWGESIVGFGNYGKLLEKPGKYRTARSCLYINKLTDLDLGELRRLIAGSVADMGGLYRCE